MTMTANGSDPAPADYFQQRLDANAKWVESLSSVHPGLLEGNAKGQWPKILWLGCSDSRVPETTILGGLPGDIFTHRNIANRLAADDLSTSAVVAYAVSFVGVEHVVLCGHTSCGGIKAAQGDDDLGLLNTWLEPLRQLRRHLHDTPGWADLDDAEQTKRLTEGNVRNGIAVLRANPDVKKAVEGRGLKLHGAIYNVATGRVEELDLDEKVDYKQDLYEKKGGD